MLKTQFWQLFHLVWTAGFKVHIGLFAGIYMSLTCFLCIDVGFFFQPIMLTSFIAFTRIVINLVEVPLKCLQVNYTWYPKQGEPGMFVERPQSSTYTFNLCISHCFGLQNSFFLPCYREILRLLFLRQSQELWLKRIFVRRILSLFSIYEAMTSDQTIPTARCAVKWTVDEL